MKTDSTLIISSLQGNYSPFQEKWIGLFKNFWAIQALDLLILEAHKSIEPSECTIKKTPELPRQDRRIKTKRKTNFKQVLL